MIYTFGKNVVDVRKGYVVTTLPDGRQLTAVAEDNDAYRAMAEKLGYGADVEAMNREHDPMHTFLCNALGLEVSPALLAKVNGESVNDLTGAEEDMVLATQRFMNLCRKEGL